MHQNTFGALPRLPSRNGGPTSKGREGRGGSLLLTGAEREGKGIRPPPKSRWVQHCSTLCVQVTESFSAVHGCSLNLAEWTFCSYLTATVNSEHLISCLSSTTDTFKCHLTSRFLEIANCKLFLLHVHKLRYQWVSIRLAAWRSG